MAKLYVNVSITIIPKIQNTFITMYLIGNEKNKLLRTWSKGTRREQHYMPRQSSYCKPNFTKAIV